MSSLVQYPSQQMALAGTIVPHEGSKFSPIAIVGEAPGENEAEARRPFIGKAGRVLEKCLHSANLARAELYLTNLVKEYTPNNDIARFYNAKQGTLTEPGKLWQQKLKEELENVQCNVVVACGNPALLALTGQHGITKWRGSVLPSTLLPGVKVIPTIHPASITWGNFVANYFIKHDLELARKESKYPEIRRRPRNYIIKPSLAESLDYLEYLTEQELIVSFDIEVTGGEVSCISFSNNPEEAISIPVMHYTPLEEVQVWKGINNILRNKKVPKLGQNVIFDQSWLLRHNSIYTRGRLECTRVAHHILFPDFPAGLDFMVSFHCHGEPYYKDEGKQWKFAQIKDWPQFWTYNAKDAALTLEVWEALRYQIMERGYWDTYRFTMDLHEPLNFMIMRGINTDQEAVELVKKVVESKKKENQEKLDKIVGYPLLATSSQKCQQYFYAELGIPPYTKYNKITKESKPTCDDKALQKLAKGTITRKPLPEARLVQEIRAAKKFAGTYLNASVDADGRFRCHYNPRGTTTGRFSSTKTLEGTGMNHQNLPKAFRTFMVPDPGYVFIELDKSQAEWVVVAYLAGDANMIHIIENNLDAHLVSGKMISGFPEEYIKLENDYVGGSRDPDDIEEKRDILEKDNLDWNRAHYLIKHPAAYIPRTFSIRQVGKHSNHGFNYDMTGGRFAMEYEVSVQEANIIHDKYFGAYPGIKKWHKRVQEQLGQNRTLQNYYGRKRRFLKEWNLDLWKSAYDFEPQSTVVDNVNRGLLRIYHAKAVWMRPIEILLQGHDSILFQYPIANLRYLALAILEGFTALDDYIEYGGRGFRIGTDMKIGFNWRDMVEVKQMPMNVSAVENLLPGWLTEAEKLHKDARQKDVDVVAALNEEEEDAA